MLNINTVTINGNTGNETAVIDLSNGPLGPGASAEGTGISEIEIVAALGLGSGDRVTVNGSAAADQLVIGTSGVNLNGDDDADITASGVENYTVSGADGDDLVSAAGGQGTGSALTLPSSLQGDQGDDISSPGWETTRSEVAPAATPWASRRLRQASPSRWLSRPRRTPAGPAPHHHGHPQPERHQRSMTC